MDKLLWIHQSMFVDFSDSARTLFEVMKASSSLHSQGSTARTLVRVWLPSPVGTQASLTSTGSEDVRPVVVP